MTEPNPNSMLHWWPLVKGVAVVPMPETILVKATEPEHDQLWDSLDNRRVPEKLIRRVAKAARRIGYPLFLRGDLTAGKHYYARTCLVSHGNELASRIWNLTEASLVGPGEVPSGFAVRKLLKLDSPFSAFHGLPIAAERRYFVRGNIVQCHHAYWPLDSLEFYDGPAPGNWEYQLAWLNEEMPAEIALLTAYAELLGAMLPGYWSVDFARDERGHWWFIDAALGEASFHWSGCPW